MDFNFAELFIGFVFGTLGIWVFREGKRNSVIPKMGLGILLFAYPYFVHSAVASFLIGSALFGASFFFR